MQDDRLSGVEQKTDSWLGNQPPLSTKNPRKVEAGITLGALGHADSQEGLSMEIREDLVPMLDRGWPEKAWREKPPVARSRFITRENATCCSCCLG